MAKNDYIKKPVVVQAFQMTEERRQDNSDWPIWLHEAWNFPHNAEGAVFPQDYPDSDGTDQLVVRTKEGLMTVSWNDWIIQGVQGELYPCKPDIFAMTYAPFE